MVLGNNGVLTQASSSVMKNEKATAFQEIQMAAADATTAYYTAWANNTTISKKDYFTETYFNTTSCPGASSITCTTATTDNGSVTGVYTAKSGRQYNYSVVVATGAVELADVGTLASMANVGDYVNINVGYVDQMNSTDYTTVTNKPKAWRVLYVDTTSEVVTLISTEHPLTFCHPDIYAELSLTEMNKISTESITVQTSSSTRGYQANGFSTNDVKSLFSNTAVFSGIQPARYSTEGVSVTSSTLKSIRQTGYSYWLGQVCPHPYNLYYVASYGSIGGSNQCTYSLRPVVSLVSGVTVSGGAGTENLPYTLNGIEY